MKKFKFKSNILKSFNKYIFYNIFHNFFHIDKNIIKKIKRDYNEKHVEDIKIFLKIKKNDNMVVNVTKTSQKIKSK